VHQGSQIYINEGTNSFGAVSNGEDDDEDRGSYKNFKITLFQTEQIVEEEPEEKIVVYRRPTQFLQSPERPQRKRLLIDSLEGMQSTPKILVTPKNQSKPLAISPTKESMFK
jgi:hypothetical protein